MSALRATRLASLGLLAGLALTAGCQQREEPWNVLLVTFDTTRADRIGVYGNERIETPTLDGLARDGIRFAHASSVAPITAPSHSTILTGLYPTAHGFRDNGLFVLEDRNLTLAEILREQGYATAAAVGAFPVVSQFGFDQGFDLFDDHLTGMYEDHLGSRTVKKEQLFFDERRAAQVNEAVLPWLDQVGDQPFFLWVHYFDPHQPFEPPPPYNQLYADDLYNGEIAYTDSRLGHLLAQLERNGQLERTLIVMTADHGEGLGEHNELTHAILAYDSTLHVPLIIRPPVDGPHRGRVVDERVGTVDIVPTVLDLLGFAAPEELHGGSLVPLWQEDGETSPGYTPRYYAENLSPRLMHGWGELRVLYDGDLKYIHGPRPEMYDLAVDPDELNDLLPEQPEQAQRMREDLAQFIQDHAADNPVSTQALDPALVQRLQSLGYLHGTGEGGEVVREELQDAGVPPQDRVTDLNRMSAAKHLLFDGRAADALSYTEKLIATGAGSPMYRELHVNALTGVGRFEEAWAMANELLAEGNLSEPLALMLTMRRFESGDLAGAIAFLQDVTELHSTPRALRLLGTLHSRAGDASAARAAIERALETDPDDVPSRVDLAVLQARSGQPGQAEVEFQRALEQAPYYVPAIYNYGTFQIELGRLDRAEALFRRAIELSPSYRQAHLALIAIQVDKGDMESAQRALRELQRIAPGSAEAQRASQLVESS